MFKPEEAPDSDDYLRRENLRLKHLINIACGAPLGGWPPKNQDWDWEGCLDDLHYAIQLGELEGTTHFQNKRHDRAGLRSLSEWLTKPERKDNPRWERLHEVNRRREKMWRKTLPDPSKPQSAEAETHSGSLPAVESRRDKRKRQTTEGMVDVFSGKQAGRDGSHESEIKELHAKIGELTVEKDFLSKAFSR